MLAIANQERIGKGLDLLKLGLAPSVEREVNSQYVQSWLDMMTRFEMLHAERVQLVLG